MYVPRKPPKVDEPHVQWKQADLSQKYEQSKREQRMNHRRDDIKLGAYQRPMEMEFDEIEDAGKVRFLLRHEF
eukprot:923128-Pyramimonas_sp.AAC.1